MLLSVLNIALALILGMCIGLERQLRQRATGLRTNALVVIRHRIKIVKNNI
jgi:putative Mg2+ transporter-C (MgtC) family protein